MIFAMINKYVICMIWRRVLCTPLPLLDGVPQVPGQVFIVVLMDLIEFVIVSRMNPEFSGEKIEFSKIDPGSLRRCLGVIRGCPESLLML